MAYDFKKEQKKFYMPGKTPELVTVPAANYIAVSGQGDPNKEDGSYQQAIAVLYAVAYTLKMSAKSGRRMEGFFDAVPPLEGFWRQKGRDNVDYSHKDSFCWTSVIRLPDFVSPEDLDWAVRTASEKKKLDCSPAVFLTVEEGLCVQIMHTGPFDSEPASVALMDQFLRENGYVNDIGETRLHHEIYLSDPRRTAPERRKTVIRHPVRKV
mgnify:CR=1 FL=1